MGVYVKNRDKFYFVKIKTNSNGLFVAYDITNAATRFSISSDGTVDVAGTLDVGAGIDVTGNISCSGTVDGRDVASDGTKLDGIESNATADQTASEIVSLLSDQDITTTGNFGTASVNITDNSPSLIFQPAVGDIVFFPSSLHHKTIPITTDADRIIVSLDLMPEAAMY